MRPAPARRHDAANGDIGSPGAGLRAAGALRSVHYVVTANDLLDGGVRYLRLGGADAGWTRDPAGATTAHDTAARDTLLAVAREDVGRNLIVDPYAVEVSCGDRGLTHTSTRERIRADGPSALGAGV